MSYVSKLVSIVRKNARNYKHTHISNFSFFPIQIVREKGQKKKTNKKNKKTQRRRTIAHVSLLMPLMFFFSFKKSYQSCVCSSVHPRPPSSTFIK